MVELEARPSRIKGKVSLMCVEVQYLVLKTSRLPSELREAKKFVISAGMASMSACGWPQMQGRRTPNGAHQTSLHVQLAVAELQSGRGPMTWV